MKRIFLFLTMIVIVCGWTSCTKKNDFKLLIGTWGLERLDYDTLDYTGAPILDLRKTYLFTPGDTDNGIEMVFREDRTGETRDHAIDSIMLADSTVIYCPDTTLYTYFTYSYYSDEGTLYLNVEGSDPYTYMTRIVKYENNAFVYESEYKKNCIEKAWLVRISNTPATKSTSKPVSRQRHEGSLFSNF